MPPTTRDATDEAASPWWDRAVGYGFAPFDPVAAAGRHRAQRSGLWSVIDRLDDLAWLGVDLLVLPHCAPSPVPGSDAAVDLTGVDDSLGGLAALHELVDSAHSRGMRLVVSLAPNHTSDRHPWFEASRSSIDDEHRGFYHWREPGPGGRPPNNWVAVTGGSAWTYDATTDQHVLTLFGTGRADLNWNNPRVVRAYDEVLATWLERGIDGFRIDGAQALVKNMLMPDNPLRFPLRDDMTPREVFVAHDHRYDLDQGGVVDLYRRWRRLTEPRGAVLIGDVELRDNDPNRVTRYVARQDGLHRAVYHAPRHVPWEPRALWDCIRDALDAAPHDLVWSASGPAHPPAVERFGGGQAGCDRLAAFLVLLVSLPGTPLLHDGDELCAASGASSREEFAAQRAQPTSSLRRLRDLLILRRSLADVGAAPVGWLTARTDPVLALRRGSLVAACNAGDGPAPLELPDGAWRIRHRSSVGAVDEPAAGRIEVPAAEGLVLTR